MLSKQLCVQPPTAAGNVALLAFPADRCAAGRPALLRAVQQWIDIACPQPAANPPHAAAAVDRRDRRTDGHQTVT